MGAESAVTMFLVGRKGHPEDHPLRLAMEEPEFLTWEVTILGVYAAQDYRAHRNLARGLVDELGNRHFKPRLPMYPRK